MLNFVVVGATVLASIVPHGHPIHRPGCHKLFTVRMTERASRAVYSGTRHVTLANLRMLGWMEGCQRDPRTADRVRRYDHHEADLWRRRRNPSAAVSSSGGWAIPWPIVRCESGGQNDPPNSAGASGYYQIIPSTWRDYGGARYAPQAYEASRSAQDVVASRIWDGGRGASQWTCAGMTGY